MKPPELIIIFLRNLVKGKVKTRLAKDLGEEETLQIYQSLCYQTIRLASQVEADVHLYYSDFIDYSLGNYNSFLQEGKDLGERMSNAFEIGLRQYSKVVLIGTDCPYITLDELTTAFQSLDFNDLVIGPCYDGGYYLIGMNRIHAHLFKDMPWSTNEVLDKTLEKCCSNKLSYILLKKYYDIDTIEDWKRYKLFLQG